MQGDLYECSAQKTEITTGENGEMLRISPRLNYMRLLHVQQSHMYLQGPLVSEGLSIDV